MLLFSWSCAKTTSCDNDNAAAHDEKFRSCETRVYDSLTELLFICSQYYKLVTFMCELYPEKVEVLSDEMLHAFMRTLQLGLSSYPFMHCTCDMAHAHMQ